MPATQPEKFVKWKLHPHTERTVLRENGTELGVLVCHAATNEDAARIVAEHQAIPQAIEALQKALYALNTIRRRRGSKPDGPVGQIVKAALAALAEGGAK